MDAVDEDMSIPDVPECDLDDLGDDNHDNGGAIKTQGIAHRDQEKWAYLLDKSTKFRPKAAPPRGKLMSNQNIDVSASPSSRPSSRPSTLPRHPRPLSRATFRNSQPAKPKSPETSRLGPTVLQMSAPQSRQLTPSRLSLPLLPKQQDDAKSGSGAGQDRLSRVMGYSRQGNEIMDRLKSGKRSNSTRTTP